jgi:DNA-binding HxlR family transcriptional regulator
MEDIKNNDGIDTIVKIHPYIKSMELGKIIGLVDTINLLKLLDESPKQYKDISTKLTLSQPTLSRRLMMLQNLNVIKKVPFRSNRRETHTYNLTPRGEQLINFINSYEKEVKLPLSQQKIVEP